MRESRLGESGKQEKIEIALSELLEQEGIVRVRQKLKQLPYYPQKITTKGATRPFLQNVTKVVARMVRTKHAQFLKNQPTNLLDAVLVRYGNTITYENRPFMTEPRYVWQGLPQCPDGHRASKMQGDGFAYCEACGEKVAPLLHESFSELSNVLSIETSAAI